MDALSASTKPLTAPAVVVVVVVVAAASEEVTAVAVVAAVAAMVAVVSLQSAVLSVFTTNFHQATAAAVVAVRNHYTSHTTVH